jgi:hypothetical protein
MVHGTCDVYRNIQAHQSVHSNSLKRKILLASARVEKRKWIFLDARKFIYLVFFFLLVKCL